MARPGGRALRDPRVKWRSKLRREEARVLVIATELRDGWNPAHPGDDFTAGRGRGDADRIITACPSRKGEGMHAGTVARGANAWPTAPQQIDAFCCPAPRVSDRGGRDPGLPWRTTRVTGSSGSPRPGPAHVQRMARDDEDVGRLRAMANVASAGGAACSRGGWWRRQRGPVVSRASPDWT